MRYSLDYFLEQYPKARPSLDPGIEQIYAAHYRENREGETGAASLAQRLEAWMHHAANAAIPDNARVLELGAGTVNHLKFPKSYGRYDIVEPFTELYEKSAFRNRIGTVYADIGEIKDQSYDVVFSIATLEHLTSLPFDVAQAVQLLEEGGAFIAAVPSEGGFLWGLAWRLSTGLEFYLRHKLNYSNLMRHEHVNDCREIQDLLSLLFERVTIRRFGIGDHFSFYQCLVCEAPRRDVCQRILAHRPPAP